MGRQPAAPHSATLLTLVLVGAEDSLQGWGSLVIFLWLFFRTGDDVHPDVVSLSLCHANSWCSELSTQSKMQVNCFACLHLACSCLLLL